MEEGIDTTPTWIYSSEYHRYTQSGISQLYYNGKWMTVDTNMKVRKDER